MSEEFISLTEIAGRLRLSRPTVLKLLRKGVIPGRLLHHGIQRVQRQVFEKWEKIKDR